MDNRCVVGTPPSASTPTRPVGSPCARASECSDGLCLSSPTIPDGYCSRTCGGDVVSSGDACPRGSDCFQINEVTSVCLDLCGAADGNCRAGYACTAAGSLRVCVPACKTDQDCSDDEACNTRSGACEAGGVRVPGKVGEACQQDSDCASQICIPDSAGKPRFPGGYCVKPCSAAEEDRPCAGQDGICVGIPRADGSKGFACLGGCGTSVDCRREYMCSADVDVQSPGGVGMCLPRCEYYDCDAGESCDATVGICTQGAPTSGPADVTFQDLGTVRVGPQEAEYATVSVQVTPQALSFSIIADSVDPRAKLVLMKMTAPNGQTVFDAANPLASGFKSVGGLVRGGGALLFPNAPRVTLVPGRYQMSWGSTLGTDVRFGVLQKNQTGVIQSATLPVVFWFTRNQFLNAQSARTNPAFQRALAGLASIYAGVGITVGPVTYLDIPGSRAADFAVIDDDDELDALFEVANDSNERAIHFFMSEQILPGEGGTILGASGGIPGPAAQPGFLHGGVAVALAFLDANVDIFAETMAHEAGHFLGLFHLSERSGRSHDPLLDTPECTTALDQNGDSRLDATECGSVGGYDNLMFWSSAAVPQRKLTNDQRFVLLRNPSVR
jgi:hypothetical protein